MIITCIRDIIIRISFGGFGGHIYYAYVFQKKKKKN